MREYIKKLRFKCLALACLVILSLSLFAQKQTLDFEACDKWIQVVDRAISNNGNYASYRIFNQPAGRQTLVLQNTSGSWKMEIPGIERSNFTEDSRYAVFMRNADTLCLLTLGTTIMESIPDVVGYQLFKQGKKEILAIHRNKALNNDLLLRQLGKNKLMSFANVSFYSLSVNGHFLVIQRIEKDINGFRQSINWVNLLTGKSIDIWKGKGNAGNFILNGSGQFAFTVEETIDSKNKKSIYLYRPNTYQAVKFETRSVKGIAELAVDQLNNFSKDGTRLYLRLKNPEFPKAKTSVVKVDVWSYLDPKLQPHQFKDIQPSPIFFGPGIPQKNYLAVIDIIKQTQIQLVYENEHEEAFLEGKNEDWLVIRQNKGGDQGEDYWNRRSKVSFHLVSPITGKRKTLKERISNLSPNGKYALGGNNTSESIFCYEMRSGLIRDLTGSLPIPKGKEGWSDALVAIKSRGLSIAGWLSDSKSVIIYDKYDIWQLDPSGVNVPVCLTNGYGRKQKIVFRFTTELNNKMLVSHQKCLLTAFNTITKENGFYQLHFAESEDPKLLTMGNYIYYAPDLALGGSAPLKAKNAEVYIVSRESASESTNYFLTRDFKLFSSLSTVYPEKAYNWMTSQLVNFKTLDGKDEQGVLYKPTDFDPNKKYPVIIHYYEKKSERINTYHVPEAANGAINIPWFVSHGYLVFTPDIHYTIGEPGESALNAVVGAANYLKACPFVEGGKIGIQGHSFGGFETNYIVTHTHMFAAAIAAAGPSDLISNYNDIWGGGYSKQVSFEKGQLRIGASLWEKPELYFKNSPILGADKITTPLLMMYNKEDGAVSFSQGVELFTALRRLGKRAWMLQYDGQSHNLNNKNTRIDYTIRMTQFFDHYLKGRPAPQWMLRGIPAKMKGIDDGLALDTSGATPGPGLLIDKTQVSN